MTHPADPQLQAYLDGELSRGDAARVAQHVDVCARCSDMVTALRFDAAAFSAAIGEIDRTEPARWAEIARRAAARPATKVRLMASGPLRWAAAIALTVSAAAAAVIAGRSVLQQRPADSTAEPAAPTAAAESTTAILLAPVEGAAIVQIEGAAAGSRLRVVTGSRAEVYVNVSNTTAVPRFRPDARTGHVVVDLGGRSGTVNIEVPALLRVGEVRVGERVVARITDGRIEPAAATTDGLSIGS